jgi:hypothetical protein
MKPACGIIAVDAAVVVVVDFVVADLRRRARSKTDTVCVRGIVNCCG